MYIIGNTYEIFDGKKRQKIKVDFEKIFNLQLRYDIDAEEAVLQYLFEKYHKLFPRLGKEIFNTIVKDYRPYEHEMYELAFEVYGV